MYALNFEMQLGLLPTSVSFFSKAVRDIKPNGQKANYFDAHFLFNWNVQKQGKAKARVTSALLENATSVVVAATVVGAAATLLIRTTKAPETAKTEKPVKICEDCGGSGICAECNGEGFVLKKLSDESAEKARLTAKNMATRYTAGLPKKWSYCTKCSSARSCSTCGGRGQLSL